MKITILSFLALFTTFFSVAQTPCEGGTANGFPCDRYDLQSRFSLAYMGANGGNDSWGWTDPDDGSEYALIGLNNGTAFIDISDPINPIYLGKLPTHTSSSSWRDIKVYDNHAFIVSEAGGHGMQVFDLTRLRSVANPPETFDNDAHYDGFGGSHNIIINEETGYAYSVGDDTYGGGLHFVNIQDPLNPVAEGGYAAGGYTHDAQIIIYDGPDQDYVGKEIVFASNADHVEIVDVTDKNNPIQIASFLYSDTGYTHQNWLTEDRNYMLLGDEGDELDFGFNTRTVVFDVSDLDNITLHMEYFGETESIDHNGYVVGDKYYLSNYSSGLRVVDISDIENGNMIAEGYFDVYPSNNNASYSGAWNVYPFFASGNIVISGSTGFFVVKESNLGLNNNDSRIFSLAPNPTTNSITIDSNTDIISTISIVDISGKLIYSEKNINNLTKSIDLSDYSEGMYFITINNQLTKKLIKK